MKVVFVAGPFRARTAWEIEQNIRRAEETALVVWEAGAIPLCPHTMNRFFNQHVPDEVVLPGVLELVRRSDAVFMVAGWEQSSGALAEKLEAERLEIPVFIELAALAAWLHKETHGTD